jgi:glycosyltransferase involved in cell wall biosynthesis
MRTVFINGKFTAQRTTGVQRSARCVVLALDRWLSSVGAVAGGVRWVLLCPQNAVVPELRHIEVRKIGWRGAPNLHLWEQVVLPVVARGAVLLNLAGAAPLLKRRQVCTFHDAAVFDCPEAFTPAFGAWYRLVFRRVARRAHLLLTVSRFSKGRLTACLDIAPARVAVMHGSGDHMLSIRPDPTTLPRLGLQPQGYFVAVGSSNPTKNFRALLAAFAGLPARCDAQLVIVGGTNDAVFASEQRPVDGEHIVRAGAVSDEELKALYQSALGLVFPSLYEGFGLPPLEAMQCGCPVAASTAASIPEACGEAALYFDPHSPAAIGAAMMRLFDEPELRQQLRARGARHARGFSWEAAARVLIQHLGTSDPTVPAGR